MKFRHRSPADVGRLSLRMALCEGRCLQVFYMFGLAGIGWSLWWESLVKSIGGEDTGVAEKLEGRQGSHGNEADKEEPGVPWRAFLRNRPVQALAYVHFCNNWYPLLSSVPCLVFFVIFQQPCSNLNLPDRITRIKCKILWGLKILKLCPVNESSRIPAILSTCKFHPSSCKPSLVFIDSLVLNVLFFNTGDPLS